MKNISTNAGALSVVLVFVVAVRSDEPTPIAHKSFAQLAQMLGSNRYEEREAATRALKSRDDAPILMREVLKTADLETRRRATEIITGALNRRFRTFAEYGRNGRIDVLTEFLGAWDVPLDDEAVWTAVVDIGWDLAKRSGLPQQNRKIIIRKNIPEKVVWDNFPFRSFPGYRELLKASPFSATYLVNPKKLNVRSIEHCLSRGYHALVAENVYASLIVNAASVKFREIGGCIVFSNDDVTVNCDTDLCVVVTDGTFRSLSGQDSIVIARKNIVSDPLPTGYSLLHAGGRVTVAPGPGNTKPPPGNNIKAGTNRPLDFVRFFETADLGIEVAPGGNGVRIVKVTAASPPAKAGLQVGDVVLRMDVEDSADVETFRRQLRRAFVQGQAVVELRRGDKVLELPIAFYGFDLLKSK